MALDTLSNYLDMGNNANTTADTTNPDTSGMSADEYAALASQGISQDSSGNFIDSVGKILSLPMVNNILMSAINPALSNIASGNTLRDATNMLKTGAGAMSSVTAPDLMSLIPNLQLQVQQGAMTPAQAQTALTQVQGQMSPASYQAALSRVQGNLNAATSNAATGSVVGTMSPAQMEIVKAVQQGTMTPAEAAAAVQKDSEMRGVTSDAASIEGMKTALGQLSTIAENRGMTDADRAQFQNAMNMANANAAQQRNAQIQQMQMQGNAGAGSELAARLAGGQQSANAGAMAGANLATNAQARALAAIQGGLSGNQALNSQLFAQDADKAKSQDLVNAFNAQAQQATNLANAGYTQGANMANFNTANDIERANAAAGTAANQYNAGNTQAANLANYNMGNQFALQNMANQQATNLSNAGFQQAANVGNFNIGNQMELANQGAANDASKYNAGNIQNANLTNYGMANTTAQQNSAAINSTNALNAGYQQNSNLTNFNTGQDIAKTNTGIMNTQAGLPLSTAQQQWVNTSGQAKDVASANLYAGNAMTTLANNQINRSNAAASQNTQPSAGGGTQGAANTVSGLTNLWNAGKDLWGTISSDERLKTNKEELSDDDVDKMMANLTGYKYRYKGPKTNPEQTGVMAQDMEKGMGSVIDTPAGKVIQPDQALGKALAILANNNSRIRKLEGK